LNRIQTARKEMSLDFTDRIEVRVGGSDRAERIAQEHATTIESECLARKVATGGPGPEVGTGTTTPREIDVEGDKVTLWITKSAR
jgi:hypothetical protein